MSLDREAIEAAAFAFFSAMENVQQASGALFKTATRKAQTWEQVAPEDTPALLMSKGNETSEKRKGLPTKWTLNFNLLLYVNTSALGDPDTIPSQVLNPLLDAIEAALEVDDISNDAVTLGGLVSHCAIAGDIQVIPGYLGNEAVAVVPIEILTTS